MKYSHLVEVYGQLEATSKRLLKTHIICNVLKESREEDLEMLGLLLQGKLFPSWDETTLGVAAKYVIKAISIATGISASKIEENWKKTGDLGETSKELIAKHKQATLLAQDLTVKKVFDNLRKLATVQGAGSVDKKTKLLAELMVSASSEEARFIVRSALEDLRLGIGEGTFRDAIVWAFVYQPDFDKEKIAINPKSREEYNAATQKVQQAYDIENDFSKVIVLAKKNELHTAKLSPGKAVKVMLYQKAIDMANAFQRVGTPCALEFKYDGFRIQAHKLNGKITLYTRRLDDVTNQFPDVAKFIEENVAGDNFILDAEVVGYDPTSKKYLPFQSISQRIKRKYEIKRMTQEFPVEVDVFDILFYNGESLLDVSFMQRREILQDAVNAIPFKIRESQIIITSSIQEAQDFYAKALAAGEEGVMAKNLEGIYKPGSRVGFGVKVKPVMETLDLVIVGAEWGEGKRSGWLTSFTLAVLDNDTGEFETIGKMGTGIKELESEGEGVTFNQLTELLKPLVFEETGREVLTRPKVVIEVKYEEIQKSTKYGSGYALRFPRLERLRIDKSVDEISDLDLVDQLYQQQRGRG